MKHEKNIDFIIGKTARSIFFIFFIGGLFLFISIIFEHFCNEMIFESFKMPCINTLEAAGIIAFGYIIYYGIRFGINSFKSESESKINARNLD